MNGRQKNKLIRKRGVARGRLKSDGPYCPVIFAAKIEDGAIQYTGDGESTTTIIFPDEARHNIKQLFIRPSKP